MNSKQYKAGWMRGADAIAHSRKTGAQLWEDGHRVNAYYGEGENLYVRAPLVPVSVRARARRERAGK
jgi:hypothetical protein